MPKWNPSVQASPTATCGRFRGRSCFLQRLSTHFYVLRLPRRGRLYQNQPVRPFRTGTSAPAEYYTYTTSEEVRTEPVQKEVRGQTITVQEDHTYTVFTLSYVGDDYFADTVWQLDDKQKSCADAYAHNLTVYLHEIEEREGITILGQINDALIDDDSPAPSGGFGNPFNDPTGNSTLLLSSANARMSAFPARIPPTTTAWTLPIPMAHRFWQ